MPGLYLYLSGNWEFSDSAMQRNYCLNCYQFLSPTVILCFYTFTFPTHSLLSQHFTSKDKDTGACTRFQHVQVRISSRVWSCDTCAMLCLVAQSCPTLPWGCSRQEYWSGLPCNPLQGIFPTQGLNLGLPHCRRILHQLSYQGSPSRHLSQFSSVTQSCPTLCDPMNSSTPGLPVHHQLPEFTQTQRPSSQ